MPDLPTAADKVLAALAALPCATVGDRTFVDRSDEEPLQVVETPGRVIRLVNDAFSLSEGMTLHRVTIEMTFLSGEPASGGTIDTVNRRAIAETIASIHEDRTLGSMLQSLEEQDASGPEPGTVDTGAAILTLEAQYFTPRGDFHTIVGQAGATF